MNSLLGTSLFHTPDMTERYSGKDIYEQYPLLPYTPKNGVVYNALDVDRSETGK